MYVCNEAMVLTYHMSIYGLIVRGVGEGVSRAVRVERNRLPAS